MRSVADFYQDCMAVAHALPPLDVQLADAVSCVLAEDVQAPFNLPVADLSACDGYAVRVRDCEGATLETPVTLPVTEEIRAGAVDPAALVPGTAIRIASGAPMPTGAEAVVSLEFTDHGIDVYKRQILRCHTCNTSIIHTKQDNTGTRSQPAHQPTSRRARQSIALRPHRRCTSPPSGRDSVSIKNAIWSAHWPPMCINRGRSPSSTRPRPRHLSLIHI